MRLPLEIAMEVGSFLDGPSVTVCTTQLCWGGVGFVLRPCTDSAKVTTIQLHCLFPLCRIASRTLGVGQEQEDGVATEAIKRIDLCLVRRTSAEKVAFVFDLTTANFRSNMAIYSAMHRHYSLSSNLQFENDPSLGVEWHARAESFSEVAFLLGKRNGFRLNDGFALRLCQSLHALDLRFADAVRDVSAFASCRSLHTLKLSGTLVNDMSALASLRSLHTLQLARTKVNDISALAS
jgi:hypothetical protein